MLQQLSVIVTLFVDCIVCPQDLLSQHLDWGVYLVPQWLHVRAPRCVVARSCLSVVPLLSSFPLSLPPAAGSCGRCQKAYGGWQRGWWLTVKVDELINVQEGVIVVP